MFIPVMVFGVKTFRAAVLREVEVAASGEGATGEDRHGPADSGTRSTMLCGKRTGSIGHSLNCFQSSAYSCRPHTVSLASFVNAPEAPARRDMLSQFTV